MEIGSTPLRRLSPRLKVSRIPREFDKWQARVPYHDLIRAYGRRGCKPLTGPERHVVVLVDTVPAHPSASYQLPVFVQGDAASKDLGAVLEACDIASTTLWLTRCG